VSSGCLPISHPHCRICRVPGRCCLIGGDCCPVLPPASVPATDRRLREAIVSEAKTATPTDRTTPDDRPDLAQLIRVEVALQLPASNPSGLLLNAPADCTIIIEQEEVERVPAADS
jgi:hypothetical protein